jgi:hypothetical protein
VFPLDPIWVTVKERGFTVRFTGASTIRLTSTTMGLLEACEVMVTVPVYGPGERLLKFTNPTVTAPGVGPDVNPLIASQLPPDCVATAALKFSTVLVVEVTAMVCVAGMFDAPACTVNEIDVGLTVICAGPPEFVMVIEKLAVAVFPHASVAVKVKLYVPLEVGVPTIDRVKSALVWTPSPGGSAPPVTPNAGDGEKSVTHAPELVNNCW